jgi:hypothetical protein
MDRGTISNGQKEETKHGKEEQKSDVEREETKVAADWGRRAAFLSAFFVICPAWTSSTPASNYIEQSSCYSSDFNNAATLFEVRAMTGVTFLCQSSEKSLWTIAVNENVVTFMESCLTRRNSLKAFVHNNSFNSSIMQSLKASLRRWKAEKTRR